MQQRSLMRRRPQGPVKYPGYPSLTALDDGDLTMTVDFRRIYATVLHDWLGLSAAQPLGQEHAPLPLLRKRA
jgi:uncharacterized protein (DUF1501 family)